MSQRQYTRKLSSNLLSFVPLLALYPLGAREADWTDVSLVKQQIFTRIHTFVKQQGRGRRFTKQNCLL